VLASLEVCYTLQDGFCKALRGGRYARKLVAAFVAVA
jgi:hypothetical protein